MQIFVQLPDNKTMTLDIADLNTPIRWIKQDLFRKFKTFTYDCYFEYQNQNNNQGGSNIRVFDESCDDQTLLELGITKESTLILKQYNRKQFIDKLESYIKQLEKENKELEAKLEKFNLKPPQIQPISAIGQQPNTQQPPQQLPPIRLNVQSKIEEPPRFTQPPQLSTPQPTPIIQPSHPLIQPIIKPQPLNIQPNFTYQDFILKCNKQNHMTEDVATICLQQQCQSPLLCAQCYQKHEHDKINFITRNQLSRHLINLQGELIELDNLQKNISSILIKAQLQCKVVEELIINFNELKSPKGYTKLQELIQKILPYIVFDQQSDCLKINGVIRQQLSKIPMDIQALFRKP